MNKKYLYIFLLLALFMVSNNVLAKESLSSKLKGKILLQVEDKGKAWYVNPTDLKRYYLGRPQDAFNLMRKLGLGVNHKFIKDHKIFPARVVGRILIDVEDNGRAYYINPKDLKAYYLGRPADAFSLMRKSGLGISNKNIEQIVTAKNYNDSVSLPPTTQPSNATTLTQDSSVLNNNPNTSTLDNSNNTTPADNNNSENTTSTTADNTSGNNLANNQISSTTTVNEIPTPPDSLLNQSTSTPINVKNLEQEVFYLVNLTRTAMNLPQLKQNDKLAEAARNHVQDMIDNNYFNYSRPGIKFNDFVDKTVGFFGYKEVGEIIADKKTSANILQSWIDDPNAKSRMLGQHTDIGVGILQKKDGTVITCVYLMTAK